METNIGNIDRIVRLFAGLALVVAAFAAQSVLLMLLGAVVLVSAVLGYCPIYGFFGVRSCRTPRTTS
jgi:hypothetical protein